MNEHQDLLHMTADTIGKELLSGLVCEIKLLPDPWQKLSKAKQDDVIDRLRARVESVVAMAVHLISSQVRTVVVGDLEQITIKNGTKAVIKIGRGAEALAMEERQEGSEQQKRPRQEGRRGISLE